MMTNIVAIGKIGAWLKPNTRMLEVERPHRNVEGKFVTDRIPIIYWSRAVNNYFMNMADGTLILVKGHIETTEVGLTILTDYMETLVPQKSE